MSGVTAFVAISAGLGRLSVSSATSGGANAVPTTITGATMTFSGNGTIRFEITNNSGGGTLQYSKNGGAFTAISDGATLAMAHGNTLAIRSLTLTVANADVVEIYNHASSALMHTFTAIGL